MIAWRATCFAVLAWIAWSMAWGWPEPSGSLENHARASPASRWDGIRAFVPSSAEVRSRALTLLDQDGIVNEDDLLVPIGHDIVIRARLSARRNGNGELWLPGLCLGIIDGHDDGFVYRGCVLTTSFIDVDGDGYLDVLVHGVGQITDCEPPRNVPVMGLYRYHPDRGEYVMEFETASVPISDVGPHEVDGDAGG